MHTLSQILKPLTRRAWVFDSLAILAGSLFIALLTQVSIPLPFTPIPLTLQSFAVLLIGGILGSKKGLLAVATYLAEGAIGLPVFAKGGAGIMVLAGPRLGYLIGFAMAAFLVGYLFERGWKRNYILASIATVSGALLILVMGAFWLSFFVGRVNAFHLGVLPFVSVDLLKALLAAILLSSGSKIFSLIR